jgi:hypothetical protein
MVTFRRTLAVLVVGGLAAMLALLTVAPTATAAKKPCWRELINDWYDGRIDKSYPVSCYREAQKHIPKDAELYSSLPDDLERALASVLGRGDDPPGPNTLVDPVPGTGRKPTVSTGPNSPEAIAGEEKNGIIDRLAPANADSIPIPLLVLAGLATLLLAAAATSFVARRLQARRVPVTREPRP